MSGLFSSTFLLPFFTRLKAVIVLPRFVLLVAGEYNVRINHNLIIHVICSICLIVSVNLEVPVLRSKVITKLLAPSRVLLGPIHAPRAHTSYRPASP